MAKRNADLVPPENNLFVQANALIEAKYKQNLSFLESFIFAKMCTMVEPEDTEFQEYKIYIGDLIHFLGITDGGQAYKNFLEAARKLKTREIFLTVKDQNDREEILETMLVTGIKRPKDGDSTSEKYIKLSFHPNLKPVLLRLKRDFTRFDVRNYKSLHSATAVRIYHLLKQYENTNSRQRVFELGELKELLGIAGKYANYGTFKQKVLDEAQRRVSEGTDINFEYEEIKKGRKVLGIRFKLLRNAGAAAAPRKALAAPLAPTIIHLPVKTEVENSFFEAVYEVAKGWGVSAATLVKLLEEHPRAAVETGLEVTKKAHAAGKIAQNVGGFFLSAVRNGYQDREAEVQKADLAKKARAEQKELEIKDREEREKEARRQRFQAEKATAFALVAKNADLKKQAIEKILAGTVSAMSYDQARSFEENMANPLCLAALINAVKALEPDEFAA